MSLLRIAYIFIGFIEVKFYETGEGRANLLETSVLSVGLKSEVIWIKNKIDLQDLAVKRWVDRLSMDELARHFDCGRTAIVRKVGQLKRNPDLILDGRARSHVKSRKHRFMGTFKKKAQNTELL